MIASHKALKKFGEENPWFTNLMVAVVANKLALPKTVRSRWLALTEMEARTIGNSLSTILLASTAANLAVDEWILTFPSLKELDRSVIWFRPMMNRIATRLVETSAFGAKFRLYFGAGLSIFDMITDIFTILRFFNEGKIGYAQASIAFIGFV